MLNNNGYGLTKDNQQPAHITADQVTFNQQTGVDTYNGHIKSQQGTTKLTADKVIITKDKANQVIKIVAIGKPAHYSTLPDKTKERLNAEANRIEYLPPQQRVTLIKNGRLHSGGNDLAGPRIIYDIAHETIKTLPDDHQQTTITIQPSKNKRLLS